MMSASWQNFIVLLTEVAWNVARSKYHPVFEEDALMSMETLLNGLIHCSKGAARVKSALKMALSTGFCPLHGKTQFTNFLLCIGKDIITTSHAYIKGFLLTMGEEQETESHLIFRGRCPDFTQLFQGKQHCCVWHGCVTGRRGGYAAGFPMQPLSWHLHMTSKWEKGDKVSFVLGFHSKMSFQPPKETEESCLLRSFLASVLRSFWLCPAASVVPHCPSGCARALSMKGEMEEGGTVLGSRSVQIYRAFEASLGWRKKNKPENMGEL